MRYFKPKFSHEANYSYSFVPLQYKPAFRGGGGGDGGMGGGGGGERHPSIFHVDLAIRGAEKMGGVVKHQSRPIDPIRTSTRAAHPPRPRWTGVTSGDILLGLSSLELELTQNPLVT